VQDDRSIAATCEGGGERFEEQRSTQAELQKVIKAYGDLGDAKTKIGTVWATPTTQTGAPLLRPGDHERKHELPSAVIGLSKSVRPSLLSMVFCERQAYALDQGCYQGLGEEAIVPDPTSDAFGFAQAGCNTPQRCEP
jgi:hypothetical protein